MSVTFKNYDWSNLDGGYRTQYDSREAVIALSNKNNTDMPWDELWDNLHHQGDVGIASYAAVVSLVDLNIKDDLGWNLYSLISCIELCRLDQKNPKLPSWLVEDYQIAIQKLLEVACLRIVNANDQNQVRSLLGFIAIAKQSHKYGELISYYSEEEIAEILKQYL